MSRIWQLPRCLLRDRLTSSATSTYPLVQARLPLSVSLREKPLDFEHLTFRRSRRISASTVHHASYSDASFPDSRSKPRSGSKPEEERIPTDFEAINKPFGYDVLNETKAPEESLEKPSFRVHYSSDDVLAGHLLSKKYFEAEPDPEAEHDLPASKRDREPFIGFKYRDLPEKAKSEDRWKLGLKIYKLAKPIFGATSRQVKEGYSERVEAIAKQTDGDKDTVELFSANLPEPSRVYFLRDVMSHYPELEPWVTNYFNRLRSRQMLDKDGDWKNPLVIKVRRSDKKFQKSHDTLHSALLEPSQSGEDTLLRHTGPARQEALLQSKALSKTIYVDELKDLPFEHLAFSRLDQSAGPNPLRQDHSAQSDKSTELDISAGQAETFGTQGQWRGAPNLPMPAKFSDSDLLRARSFFADHEPFELWSGDEWQQQAHSHLQASPSDPVPEVAFLGRSNVGKSSLLNAVLDKNKIFAKHGKVPGTTKTMRAYGLSKARYQIKRVKQKESRDEAARDQKSRDQDSAKPILVGAGSSNDNAIKIAIIDSPGYGHGSNSMQGQNIIKYFQSRKQLKMIFMLIHASAGFKDRDRHLIELLNQSGIPWQVIVTQADRKFTPATAKSSGVHLEQDVEQAFQFARIRANLTNSPWAREVLPNVPITVVGNLEWKKYFFSRENSYGADEVRARILTAAGLFVPEEVGKSSENGEESKKVEESRGFGGSYGTEWLSGLETEYAFKRSKILGGSESFEGDPDESNSPRMRAIKIQQQRRDLDEFKPRGMGDKKWRKRVTKLIRDLQIPLRKQKKEKWQLKLEGCLKLKMEERLVKEGGKEADETIIEIDEPIVKTDEPGIKTDERSSQTNEATKEIRPATTETSEIVKQLNTVTKTNEIVKQLQSAAIETKKIKKEMKAIEREMRTEEQHPNPKSNYNANPSPGREKPSWQMKMQRRLKRKQELGLSQRWSDGPLIER